MVGHYEGGGVSEKYRLVHELRGSFSVTALCKEVGVSRSGYYDYLDRMNEDKDAESKALIQKTYTRYNGIYGYRQVQLFLHQDHGVWMNHKKVLRLMQEIGLSARIRRKYRHHARTWNTGDRVVKNVLARKFEADAPNQKWVTDVTQYRVGNEWLYLSAIKDLYDNSIVAYHMSERNDLELVLTTFKKAFKGKKDVAGMVVHSDQGSQYTSYKYHDMLPKVGAQISMSRRGNCYDNASMESFFSHLKTEALYPYHIRSVQEAQRRIKAYIHFYNNRRPQRKLNKLTPAQYRNQLVG
ncbi:IS3 family transposase [Cohnella ginsengisoli]|uniref:IS3 family transposase n=1 Tax=Cohnella ginsengisoli TaxID=425004 RepID=A0A9X4QLL7_9BACL|nr:IS3 family transposase [Cohnella ginsengisoli]MDG0790595.1 IS3 family transposase [Cohnella ginsengisoli]MDG0792579.1 IS3 family transposase [Cohnella ginsengisoli]